MNIHNEWESIEKINAKTLWVTLILPFFSGRIEGFSLEENISYDAWYQGRWSGKIHWDAWEWKAQEVADVVSRIGVRLSEWPICSLLYYLQ